jgi:hypothetical protein
MPTYRGKTSATSRGANSLANRAIRGGRALGDALQNETLLSKCSLRGPQIRVFAPEFAGSRLAI